MPANTKTSAASRNYAEAMLELADEQGQAEALGQEMRDLKQLIESEPTFKLFLRDPAIGEKEREETLERIFKGRASTLVMKLMGVLNHKGRLRLLEQILDAYHDLLDQKMGRIQVDVTVAEALDPAALEDVRQRIGRALNKDARIREHVNAGIIGGLVVQVEDKLMDASVQSQLEAMRKRFVAAAPRR